MDASLIVLSLAAELDSCSLYSDYQLNKTELASLLNCSRTSIYDWSDIAWAVSSDFRKDTPQNDETFEYMRDEPYTPYQVWLISRIQKLLKRTRSATRTKKYIKDNPNSSSKARFDELTAIIKEKLVS